MSVTINVISREFIDFDFNFERHPLSDNLNIKKNINAVKQSVIHLLQLKRGDVPFNMEMRSPVGDYLFENASAAVKIVLEREIKNYLNRYEPRLTIRKVTVTFPDVNEISVDVDGEIVNVSAPVTINILINRFR